MVTFYRQPTTGENSSTSKCGISRVTLLIYKPKTVEVSYFLLGLQTSLINSSFVIFLSPSESTSKNIDCNIQTKRYSKILWIQYLTTQIVLGVF